MLTSKLFIFSSITSIFFLSIFISHLFSNIKEDILSGLYSDKKSPPTLLSMGSVISHSDAPHIFIHHKPIFKIQDRV